MNWARSIVSVVLIVAAYFAGVNSVNHRCDQEVEDAIIRVAETQYFIMDLCARNLHYAKGHKSPNPYCQECHDLKVKFKSHGIEVNKDNAAEVFKQIQKGLK